MEVMTNLLEFNPYDRSSAAELLKNPVFDKVRDPIMERRAEK
jgi:hypothetical protein